MINEVKIVSKKFAGRRKAKPKFIAVVTDRCTGCASSPICKVYCPVDDCITTVSAQEYPLKRIRIDPLKCIGCRKCTSDGPMGLLLDGCPWDAIKMVSTPRWEDENYSLPY